MNKTFISNKTPKKANKNQEECEEKSKQSDQSFEKGKLKLIKTAALLD